jgi:phospholipid transport system substrate-binding protein
MHRLYCRRRALIAATAALFISAAIPGRAAENQAVIAPIQHLVGGLLEVMRAGTATPFSRRFDMLAPIIDQTFDLTAILQESVGPWWTTMSPEQQTALLQAFRRYTVSSYVNNFDSYNSQRFEVDSGTRAVGDEQVVQTRLIPRSGESHELDYVMREVGSGWRAVDVLADGSISRVAVQRSDFRRLLTRGGAQALVDSLLTKSADLSSDGAG